MIASNELPEPDEVEYTQGSVYFRWNEQKLVVAVDLDDPAPLAAPRLRYASSPGDCGSPSVIS